jgi:phage terminase large subunit
MLPQYNQCRKAIWEAINPRTGRKRIDDAFPPEMRAATRNTDMYIQFHNGSSWQLVGSDNFNALVGSPPVGLVLSEYALADPQCWAYLSPILEENGGWASFISTSRGNNHLKKILDHARVTPGWFAETLTADQTPVFTAMKLKEIKSELIGAFGEEMGVAMFEQEYNCSFQGAVLGAYYARQMLQARNDGRITNVPYVTGSEVYTFWDLGVDDSTTIWFMQFVGRETRVIDYYEKSGMGMAHFAKVLKEKPYVYGDHYMPHDAKQRMMGDSEFAKSKKDVAEDLGLKPVIVVNRARDTESVLAGIEAVRNALSTCYFDEKKCIDGIAALEAYKSEYDEEKKVMRNTPFHDWCFASETYLLTKSGKCQIMDLPNSGEVMTLCGWKQYVNPRITRRNAQLVEVVFSDGLMVRCTPEHLFLTEFGWKSAESLTKDLVIQSSLTHLRNTLMVVSTEFGQVKNILLAAGKSCIEKFGNLLSGLFQKVAIFTINEKGIPLTAGYLISNVYQQQNTSPGIGKIYMKTERNTSAISQERKLLNGINQKRDDYGTVDMRLGPRVGLNGNVSLESVRFVLKSFLRSFVRAVIPKSIVNHVVNPLRVACVNQVNTTEDVWCITVPGSEHFSLSNGAVVHNCSHGADAFRTFAMGYAPKRIAKPGKRRVLSGWAA